MDRARSLLRSYWFDAVIVLAAVGGVLELVLDTDREGAPTVTFWVSVPAQLLLILPLLARRLSPFGVPVAILLFAAAISFVDGNLVPFTFATFLSILSCFCLLGSLRSWHQALAGLAIGLLCGLVVTRNDPDAGVGDWLFIPVVFTVGWLTGFAPQPAARGGARRPRSAPMRARARARRGGSRAPSRRSGSGSRASSTTSSRTRSA